MKNICFIGYGNMAKSIAQGLRQHPRFHLSASSPSLSRSINEDGVKTYANNLEHVHQADVLLIAVKPNKVLDVLHDLHDLIPAHCVILSIAAGIRLETLARACSTGQAIVRGMPNTPIAVGKGATPLIANAFVNVSQKALVDSLFQCSGITSWIDCEADMDSFTALSGSGPAYVFLFMEAMESAARKLGLPDEQARSFTLQTVSGAVALAEQSEQSAQDLRKKVTSPAGTTAAAIAILQQRGLDELIYDAMQAAKARAREMGSEH